MDTQALRLLIQAEAGQAIREMDSLKKSAQGAEAQSKLLGAALKAVNFAAVAGFVKDTVDAFVSAERALAKLGAVYKATGGTVGLTTNELVSFSSELEASTGFADDAIQNMEALLLTFRNIKGEGFKDTARLALDLAAVMGGDISGAAMQLGKALEDPANGVSMLNRQLRLFSDAELETIKNMTETNRTAEAQEMIMEALEARVGGTAEAMNRTLGGAMQNAANATDNLMEVIGEGLAPSLQIVANLIEQTAKALQEVPAPVLAGATAMTAMTVGVQSLTAAAVALGIKLPAAFGPIGIAVAGVTALVIALTAAYQDQEKALKELYDAKEKLLEIENELTNAAQSAVMASGIDAQIQTTEQLIATLKEQNRLMAAGRNYDAATVRFNNEQIAQNEQLLVNLREQKAEQLRLLGTEEERAKAAKEEEARAERLARQAKVMARADQERAAALAELIALQNEKTQPKRTAITVGASLQTPDETYADLIEQYTALATDMTDLDPFKGMTDSANKFLEAISYWGPAIDGVGKVLGELDAQWKAQNAAYLKGLQKNMEMESLRYDNLIASAQAAGQETSMIEQQKADAELVATEKLNAEKARIGREEFERDKAAKLVQIAMATALGVANALSIGPGGIPLAAVIGGLGAAQAGIVAGSQYPGLANGGTVSSAGTVMVGERGPELLSLPRAARVTPLDKAGGVTIVISGNTFAGPGGVDDLVKTISTRMDQLKRTGVLV